MEQKSEWFDKKSFVSALLGAFLALLGGIIYYNFERYQLGKDIASQIKWEVYENITDTFSNISSYDQAKTFKDLGELPPGSSIQNSNFFYLVRHSLRNDFFKTRVGDFNLLNKSVMRDALEFYSLLYSVDESERQMENIFINKVPLKAETVSGIANDIADNTKKMRTMGAQVVGKIMYYYDSYDLEIKQKDDPKISRHNIILNLYKETLKQVEGTKSGELINTHEVAEKLQLLNPEVFICDASHFDVCALATAHFLILKTGKVLEDVQVYNGYIRK